MVTLLAWAAVGMWACTGPKPATRGPAPTAAAATPPVLVAVPLPDPTTLLRLVIDRLEGVRSVGAVLRMRGLQPLPGTSVWADVWLGRPSHAYVGVRGPLGPPLDEVVTDGAQWSWNSLRPQGGGHGPVTQDGLAPLLPLPVPVDAWVGALLGLPLPNRPPRAVAACTPDHTLWCLTVEDTEGSVRLEGNAAALVLRATLSHQGQEAVLEYDQPQPLGDLWLHHHVRAWRTSQPAERVDLWLRQVEFNTPFPAPLFVPLGDALPWRSDVR